ncbi:hypothetical protein H6P81_008272 [Aristolochia fimbriata]|uniref:Uncharacterized protein n=1 Tax=Aristolochia fimbriata TaxID=158543 RepID=A0AAV7F2W0_ARIFI|nr:hypothetical protein H6P81_008272 [Aristolochia fimbriata]
MISLQALQGFNFLSSSHSNPSLLPTLSDVPSFSRSVRFQNSCVQPLESDWTFDELSQKDEISYGSLSQEPGPEERERNGINEERRISGITVPRQRYISVPKKELLDGILSLFDSQEQVEEFLQFSSCLDSILHAEHKSVLEEMRVDYSFSQSMNIRESDPLDTKESKGETNLNQKLNGNVVEYSRSFEGNVQTAYGLDSLMSLQGLDLRFLFSSSPRNEKPSSSYDSSVAVATRFQQAFMKLLHDAQFEELSAQDLLLTSALNTDYLLTLPIYVDWKRASESKAIIFRRGYATEKQKGFLIVEKLDYLQSKLLQKIFFSLSRPIKAAGQWINEAMKSSVQSDELQELIERFNIWLKDLTLSERGDAYSDATVNDQALADSVLPIWVAAQRAIPRYEGFLSSIGPRGRLLRKMLMGVGLIPSSPNTSFEFDKESMMSEPHLRPNRLPRISLSDIWEPASRENCGNDLWKMFKTAISILFSKSTLQEPAFQELILLYTDAMSQQDADEKAGVSSLELKIYENIPIPDLPVIFPHKKLSFRILDTVRLDVASILGLLAFLVNYRFENILSSPSAFPLDVIAVSALILYATRVVLGYKQTRDRYQLLVNKTLYEKTLASGFGSVHFLLDASEQQQYKEAILAYGLLLHGRKHEVVTPKSISATCERFVYDMFKEKIEMPIDKAMDTLLRLGLVNEVSFKETSILQPLPCSKAYEALKRRWDNLLK